MFSSMGHLGNIEHADVQETIREAVERLAAIGVASATLAFDPAVAERYVGYGYQMVCVGSDQSCLMGASAVEHALHDHLINGIDQVWLTNCSATISCCWSPCYRLSRTSSRLVV